MQPVGQPSEPLDLDDIGRRIAAGASALRRLQRVTVGLGEMQLIAGAIACAEILVRHVQPATTGTASENPLVRRPGWQMARCQLGHLTYAAPAAEVSLACHCGQLLGAGRSIWRPIHKGRG